MKFPKERVIINSKIKEYLKSEKYFDILKLKDEILEKYEVLDEYSFNTLIKTTFMLGDFDSVVTIFTDLFNKEIENYTLLYYGLLGMIANLDLYLAKSYIKKSKLLNQAEVKEFIQEDGANYSNILNLCDINMDCSLTLVLVNFIEGIIKEVIGDIELDREYILFRLFDLINMLYEIGYPDIVISKLTGALKIIFNLDV